MALANGPDPKHKMSLGSAMSYVRWSERKAEVEAWVAAAWAAAKRRWTARWMPIVAAVGILAALVLVGALNGVAALIGILVLMLATATWPLELGRHPQCDLGKYGSRTCASRRRGAGKLAGGSRCDSDGGAGARCSGHPGAP